MGETNPGKEVTNFHPICDGSNLVHEAMKLKSGATPPAASAPSQRLSPPPFPRSQLSFFAYLAIKSQISSVQEVSQIHQSETTVIERQISGAVWARS